MRIAEYGLTEYEKSSLAKFLKSHENICPHIRKKYSLVYSTDNVAVCCKECDLKHKLSRSIISND